ncbi:MAG: McrC family protein [Rhodanobacteraceae bacterium]|nr:McrC family protein [Rhodanobacteraceae bacterium]
MARSIHEFDTLAAENPAASLAAASTDGLHTVPANVFAWLEQQALRCTGNGTAAWLRLTQRRNLRAVQLRSFVGVIRAPDGFQIEVLPKIGKALDGGETQARQLLLRMLSCLRGFRHIRTDRAGLAAVHMPLLEVFIGEFLLSVAPIVKRGLHSDYRLQQGNLFTLRGKLQIAQHLRQNLCRRDRFHAEYDEFSTDRPENRLLHAALREVLSWTTVQEHQQLTRELCFALAEVPMSEHVAADFRRVRLDRGMAGYADALAWARLILQDESPLTGSGVHDAPSLLFPMEAVFEAFVTHHLARRLAPGLTLRPQARSRALVRHQQQDWFQLQPDLLIQASGTHRCVLDAKWKLLDQDKTGARAKYGLDPSDFYQLHAYGQSYLDGQGDVVLIYPRTDTFDQPLPVFEFPKSRGLRLWVLPFCLQHAQLLLPACGGLDGMLMPAPQRPAHGKPHPAGLLNSTQ